MAARGAGPERWQAGPGRRGAPRNGRGIALALAVVLGCCAACSTSAALTHHDPTTTRPSPPVPPDYAVPYGPKGDWRLVFADNFAGTTLDKAHWSTCYYWDCTNPGNDELEWYEPSQVTVQDGTVSLTAQPALAHGKTYVSGMLSSYGKFSFEYGYAQVVAKLPVGQGMWSAFWALPEAGGFPPEIDIMENLAQFDRVYLFVHFPPSNRDAAHVVLPTYNTEFHTYGVDWEPGSISWYVDGVLTAREAVSIAKPMYLLADLAVAGNPAPTSAEQFPQSLEIKSIEVWQHQAPPPPSAPATP
jgi:beta-glucanase (GH16 family)